MIWLAVCTLSLYFDWKDPTAEARWNEFDGIQARCLPPSCLRRHDSSAAFIVLFVEVESGSRWDPTRIAASMLIWGVEGFMETETLIHRDENSFLWVRTSSSRV